MMATVGSSDGSLRSTASPRTRRRNGPSTYRFINTSRHSSWTGKSSIATSARPSRPDGCRVPDDAASPSPERWRNLRRGHWKGKGPPAARERERLRRARGPLWRLLNLADAEPAEVDVLGAVPAEGGDGAAPGDRHRRVAGAASARVAAEAAVIRQIVDLRPRHAVGVVVQPQLHLPHRLAGDDHVAHDRLEPDPAAHDRARRLRVGRVAIA